MDQRNLRRALLATGGCAMLLASASPALAAIHPSGTLHFSGYYSGTIKLPPAVDANPACLWAKGFSTTNGHAAVQLSFGTVKLSVNGHEETLPGLQLTFGLGKFGGTEPVQDVVNDNPSKATAGIVYKRDGALTGIATGSSGTVSTAADGTSGSVNAGFAREQNFKMVPGATTISGSWSGCNKAPSIDTF
ncbi:MAG TPA: hypothetical protein VEJ84_15330 [Acidimicrobiales bacterium]|nr:hypothetical protein [Acidimicrobiales bacterium]